MRKTAYLLLLALAAAACDVAMPADVGKTPLLYVECIPGLSDTVAVQLIVTAPEFGFSESYVPKDAKVSLSVDGSPVALAAGGIDEEGFPVGAWYGKTVLPKGASVRLSASVPGLPEVSASTVIPQLPASFTPSVDKATVFNGLNAPEQMVRYSVTFDSPRDKDSYIGLMVERRRGTEVSWVWFDGISSESSDLAFYPERSQVTAFMTRWAFTESRLGSRLVLWQATDMKDQKRLEAYDRSATGSASEYEYRFHVFSASPEFYRYARSRQMSDPDETIAPLIPSSYAFNNVRGGCGVLGGLSEYVTDWIRMK